MARVTVEDCIDKVPNRYELLMIAAQRAKDIEAGAHLQVNRDNDKNSVVALREIAENKVSIEDLQRSLVMNLQKYVEVEEPEEEELEILAAEKELSELDSQFDSSMLLDAEVEDTMQIRESDDSFDDGLEDEYVEEVSEDFGEEDFADDFAQGSEEFE